MAFESVAALCASLENILLVDGKEAGKELRHWKEGGEIDMVKSCIAPIILMCLREGDVHVFALTCEMMDRIVRLHENQTILQ